jgi:hypothetical protein
MGGDGGVVASNRKYMRGAGTADHTANSAKNATLDPALEREELVAQMHTCAVSGQPLELGSNKDKKPIVVCPYGRLYYKEAAVEALLQRKQKDDHRINHIRGLKDLHPVRFHFVDSIPVCPITAVELNGQVACYVLVPGKVGDGDETSTPNVVSERAFKQLGEEALVEEYGPMEQKIRLIPPSVALKEIKEEWQAKVEAEKSKKKSKSALKKRKRELETTVATNKDDPNNKEEDGTIKDARTSSCGKQTRTEGTEAAVAKVSAAVQASTSSDRNTVLSSLFTTADAKISDKDKKDNLFARC